MRANSPDINSVIEVITQLLERLGLLFHLYGQIEPAGRDPFASRRPRDAQKPAGIGFAERLATWGERGLGAFYAADWKGEDVPAALDREHIQELANVRQLVRNWLPDVSRPPRSGPPRAGSPPPAPTLLYRDPVDHLRRVFVATRTPPAPAVTQPPRPGPRAVTLEQLVPPLIRGPAHGDLHGRNVLVGVTRGRAVWPAVFDYEDMDPQNLVGWDYAKLETELKVRAYPFVFAPKLDSEYAEQVHRFEWDLADRTDFRAQGQVAPTAPRGTGPTGEAGKGAHRDQAPGVVWADTWPEFDPGKDARSRLMAVLLTIRQMSAWHLGALRQRRRPDWHEEYFFLLAWYAVVTGKFNLQPRERIAALVSGGVAVARLNAVRDPLAAEYAFTHTVLPPR